MINTENISCPICDGLSFSKIFNDSIPISFLDQLKTFRNSFKKITKLLTCFKIKSNFNFTQIKRKLD